MAATASSMVSSGGMNSQAARGGRVHRGLTQLMDEARGRATDAPVAVHAMMRLGDVVYLAGAAAVTSFSQPADPSTARPVLVMLTALDAGTLNAISMATRSRP